MENVTLTRKELYDLVWSVSMVSLTRMYRITSSSLRKTCTKMEIPIPKAGHWEKLKWGKQVAIEKLNETYTGESSVILIVKNDQDEEVGTSPLEILRNKIEKDTRLSLKVPLKLTDPDKLIVAARDSLNSKAHKDYHNGMLSTAHEELSIKVSPEFVSRALRFMDTLIKALKARGHRVYIRNWETCASIFDEEFIISFKEKTKRVPPRNKIGSSDFEPTGLLYFKATRISYHKDWIDKTMKLEDQLSSIIAGMEIEAERRKKEKEFHQKQWEERDAQEQKEKKDEQQKDKEVEDFRELLREAKLWGQITTLRDYADAIEAKAIANNNRSEALKEWLKSVRRQAQLYDPIEERIKQILSLEN